MPGNTITVTNSFVANTKAKSAEVNTNFTDILEGLSDGTKDIAISGLYVRDLPLSSTFTITSSLTLTSHTFLCSPDTTTGMTIFLPTASDSDGRLFNFKNLTGNGPLSIIPLITATTLDQLSNTSIELAATGDSLQIICDNSNYHSLDKRLATTAQAGAVAFKEQFEKKQLSADVTTAITVTDLTFTTTVGRTYEILFQAYFVVGNAGLILVEIRDGATTIGRIIAENQPSDGASNHIFGWPTIYTAGGTSLTFVITSISGTGTAFKGNSDNLETFVILREVSNSESGSIT